MQTSSTKKRGTILFGIGLLAGLALATIAVWGDFEGMSYFSSAAGYAGFPGLHCPVIMGPTETATVSAEFSNSTNETAQPYYQVWVSGLAAVRAFENQIDVPPHSSRTVAWTVNAGDIDLGSFVMVKVDVLPTADFGTRESTCGIMVLPLPGITGNQAAGALLAISLLGIFIGLALREGREEPFPGKEANLRNGMRAAGILTLLAVLTALPGLWLFGLIFAALAVLLVLILFAVA